MYGIVSLLDAEHNAIVEGIWQEFMQKFGVHGVHQTPIAHFSYHVAPQYHFTQMQEILARLAVDFIPFRVRTVGLGIFTGAEPVLYVKIRPTLELYQLQQRVYEAVLPLAVDPHPLYTPEMWIPHITLAHGDVDHELLPQVVHLLSARGFYWHMEVNNLALVGSDEGEIHTLRVQIPFGAKP